MDIPLLWLYVQKFAYLIAGGLGVELVRYLLRRSREQHELLKLDAEAKHITATGNLAAFQVADESLSEWMLTAKHATQELLAAVRRISELEIYIDEAIHLLERCVQLLTAAEVEGVQTLSAALTELKRARRKHVQQQETSGAPEKKE